MEIWFPFLIRLSDLNGSLGVPLPGVLFTKTVKLVVHVHSKIQLVHLSYRSLKYFSMQFQWNVSKSSIFNLLVIKPSVLPIFEKKIKDFISNQDIVMCIRPLNKSSLKGDIIIWKDFRKSISKYLWNYLLIGLL